MTGQETRYRWRNDDSGGADIAHVAGKSRKTFALLALRLESGALGYRIAHGVGRTMDALSEYPDVALGCAGVSGTTSSWAYDGCSQ